MGDFVQVVDHTVKVSTGPHRSKAPPSTVAELEKTEALQAEGFDDVDNVVWPSGDKEEQREVALVTAASATQAAEEVSELKPSLPPARVPFSGFTSDDKRLTKEEVMGLIAIIGEVLAAQAKSNSNYWKSLWDQASQSMLAQVKMAPLIAACVRSAYEAQAAGTKATADDAQQTAWVNISCFVIAVVMGGAMEFGSSAESEAITQSAAQATNETAVAENAAASSASTMAETTGAAAGSAAENTAATATQEAAGAVQKEVSSATTTFMGRATKSLSYIKNIGSQVGKRMGSMMGHSLKTMIASDMLSRAATGFIDAKYKTIQAAQQQVEGQFQANTKQLEQYNQFLAQDFNRSDNLSQGVQQNIDYCMNILKSESDTMTQTVSAMFRG